MRKTLLSMLAVAVLLGASSTGLAQLAPAGAGKTVLTIAVSSYDELLADIGAIGKLGGDPQLAQTLEAQLNEMTQGKGLVGLDKTKRWGAVVQTGGPQGFTLIGFVPVTDLKQLLDALAPIIGQSEDAGNGVLKINVPGALGAMTSPGPVYVKEQGGWAFIADSPDALANVPADPAKVISGIDAKYDVAVRGSVQNVPAPMRAAFTQELKQGAEAAMMRLPGESDEDYALRTGVAKRALDQFVTMTNELDSVFAGLAVDRQAGTSYLDLEVTAVEGSETAAQFQMSPGKTNFAGFDLPGAAVTANWASPLTDSDVTQLKTLVGGLRTAAMKELEADQDLSDEERKLATQLLGDVLDVLNTTIDKKQSDGGLALLLNPGAVTLVAGGAIGDGDKLEKVIKQLVQLVTQEEPGLAELVKLDAETHGGVRFHTLTLPVPDPDIAKLVGPTLDVVVGINDQSVYLAAGADAASTLKQVIDKSKAEAGKQVPPARISIALASILQFATSVVDDEMGKIVLDLLVKELGKSSGKDHIILTVQPITNGARMQVKVEEGILALIGSVQRIQQEMMKKMMEQMMGPGAAPGESPF